MRSEKYQIKRRKDQVWWSSEGKEEVKERKVRARRRHVIFVTEKVVERIIASMDKSG